MEYKVECFGLSMFSPTPAPSGIWWHVSLPISIAAILPDAGPWWDHTSGLFHTDRAGTEVWHVPLVLGLQIFLRFLFLPLLLLCFGPCLVVLGCCVSEFLLEVSEILLGFWSFLFSAFIASASLFSRTDVASSQAMTSSLQLSCFMPKAILCLVCCKHSSSVQRGRNFLMSLKTMVNKVAAAGISTEYCFASWVKWHFSTFQKPYLAATCRKPSGFLSLTARIPRSFASPPPALPRWWFCQVGDFQSKWQAWSSWF